MVKEGFCMMKEGLRGLSSEEVQQRIQAQQTNQFKAKVSDSNWKIVRRNVFTSFNALNFVVSWHY